MDFFLDYKERGVVHTILQRPLSRSNNGIDTNREHYLLQKVFSDKLNHIGVSEAFCQGPMVQVIIRPSCCHSLDWLMLNIMKRKFSALKSYVANTVSCHYEYILSPLFDQLRSCRYLLVWSMKYPQTKRSSVFSELACGIQLHTLRRKKKKRCLCIV